MSKNIPGREPKKEPLGALERLRQAADKGRLRAFTKALEALQRGEGEGNWQHRALSAVIGGSRVEAPAMMALLFHGSQPPKPSEKEEFVAIAIESGALNCLPQLHAGGFALKKDGTHGAKAISKMLFHMSQGHWPHAELIYPDILRHEKGESNLFWRNFPYSALTQKRETGPLNLEHLNCLARLDMPENISALFTDAFLKFARQDSAVLKAGPIEILGPGLTRLFQLGWLQPDEIERKGEPLRKTENLRSLDKILTIVRETLGEHERLGLEANTAPAERTSNTKRKVRL